MLQLIKLMIRIRKQFILCTERDEGNIRVKASQRPQRNAVGTSDSLARVAVIVPE